MTLRFAAAAHSLAAVCQAELERARIPITVSHIFKEREPNHKAYAPVAEKLVQLAARELGLVFEIIVHGFGDERCGVPLFMGPALVDVCCLTTDQRIVCERTARALIWINPERLRPLQYLCNKRRPSCKESLSRWTAHPAQITRSNVIAISKMGADAQVHLLHVQPPLVPRDVADIAKPGLVERPGFDDADHSFAAAKQLLEEAGVRYSTRTEMGDPAREIALYADVHDCAEIVMGTRGMGPIKNLLMGSVATKVLHLVNTPVTLVK